MVEHQPFNIQIECGSPCGLTDRCGGMGPVISVPPENMLHICEELMLNRPLISNFSFFPCGCFASCTTVRWSNMSMHFSCSQCAPSITISCWIASYCFEFFLLCMAMWSKYALLIFLSSVLKTNTIVVLSVTPVSYLINNLRFVHPRLKILSASSLNSHPQCQSRFFSPLSATSPCAF